MQRQFHAALLALVVVVDMRLDFYALKAVSFVKILDGRDIRLQQRLAEKSCGKKQAGWRDAHAFADGVVVEIFVAFDSELGQFVPRAQVNAVDDGRVLAPGVSAVSKVYGDVKVAF